MAHATEAVWELAEHRFVFIEEQVKDAGHAQHTIFVDDLDARIEQIAGRGLPHSWSCVAPARRQLRMFRPHDLREAMRAQGFVIPSYTRYHEDRDLAP